MRKNPASLSQVLPKSTSFVTLRRTVIHNLACGRPLSGRKDKSDGDGETTLHNILAGTLASCRLQTRHEPRFWNKTFAAYIYTVACLQNCNNYTSFRASYVTDLPMP